MAGFLDVLTGISKLLTLTSGPSPGKVKLKQFPGGTIDWVGFPWGDEKAMQALTQSQYGLEYIGELICMSNRLQKVNKMSEMPGKTSLPGLAKKPERFWSENPISKARWQSGEMALRVTFSESPRTNIVITNKSDRTIRVGSRLEVHLGGPESSFNLSQRYMATEELEHFHLAHTVYHYACNKPVDYVDATAFDLERRLQNLKALETEQTSCHPKEIELAKKALRGVIKLEDLGSMSLPGSDRDVTRDRRKHRTQVWSRYEGVARWEAVKTEPTKQSSPNYYEGDLNMVVNKTPIFTDKSPEALFEIRPAEFTTEEKAAMIMATPTFVLCGMVNHGQFNHSLNDSAEIWVQGGAEQKDDDNFFAVRNQKSYKENWEKILPSAPEGGLNMSYGILGGTKTIVGKTEKGTPFLAGDGLELYGRHVVSIGAGFKSNNIWKSGLIVKDDIVELRQSAEDDKNKSLISMQSELLELRNEVANLKSMIRMDKDGITLSVGDTKIQIKAGSINFSVETIDVGDFNKDGWHSKVAKRLGPLGFRT